MPVPEDRGDHGTVDARRSRKARRQGHSINEAGAMVLERLKRPFVFPAPRTQHLRALEEAPIGPLANRVARLAR
jgi:hypothetical protein